jgi:DNA polymerase elongation subunit (family B)
LPEYQYITAYYDGDSKNIIMWVRDIQSYEKKKLHITGFQPYFYVPETDDVPKEPWVVDIQYGFTHMDGKPDKKIIVTDPLQVSNNRDRFSSAHEADINYIQRLLIDTEILSCFAVPTNSDVIPYYSMKPIIKTILPHIVYMDIEVQTKGRFPNVRSPTAPIVAVTFYDNLHKKYLTICADDRVHEQVDLQPEPDWMVRKVTSPGHLLSAILEYLNYMQPDIITGWNISFDIDYLVSWAKYNFKKDIPIGKSEEIFDLLEAYKKSKSSIGNRLKEVVVKEGIIKSEDMVSESFKIDMYTDWKQRDTFILYNKMDTEYCVKLNSGFKRVTDGKFIQYDFIENFWNSRNFVGLNTINYTTQHVKRHDPLWLRTAKKLGFTLPSGGQSEESEDEGGLEFGGVVFTPPPGIYRNLTVLDMSRYYPSILLSFPNETSPDIWGKLAPAVINYLSAERDYWDTELAKHVPGTEEFKTTKVSLTRAKTFLSGAWGYFAYAGSRIYSKKRGDFVLKTGGDGLRRVRQRASKIGHETVYGDTDSIFIDSEPDDVESLVGEVNEELTLWATEMGLKDSRFHIKEDRFAKTTLFIEKKNSQEGAKKRYGQRIVRENGDPCDYILVKGFDYVRGNTSEITRKLQKEIIDFVLMDNTKEIIPKIRDIINNINTRKYDLDQITIPINLSKPFGPNIKTGGEYYDGANWNNKYIGESIISGDMVRYFQTKSCGRMPYNKWVSYLDSKNVQDRGIVPDYDWIINRTLRSPLESILSAAGIKWDNILGFQNAKDFFGD